MKQILRLILAVMIVIMASHNAFSQIPGKIYQLGDTLVMDGMSCLVFHVDDSGMHGSVMAPYVRTEKELEKAKKEGSKHFEKEIKKERATDADLVLWQSTFEGLSRFSEIKKEKVKGGGFVFHVCEWLTQIPFGWRAPSKQDAEAFATFYCGGLGKENGIKSKFTSPVNELVPDEIWRKNLIYLIYKGMIVSDSGISDDVQFLHQIFVPLKSISYLELRESFIGTEKTVAVRDF